MPFKYSESHRIRLAVMEARQYQKPNPDRFKAILRLKAKIAKFLRGPVDPPTQAQTNGRLPWLGLFAKPNKKRKRGKVNRRDSYREYIDSDKWREFKASIIMERGKVCENCRATPRTIDLHHLTYARFKNERSEDVKLLCRKCHAAVHGVKDFKSKR